MTGNCFQWLQHFSGPSKSPQPQVTRQKPPEVAPEIETREEALDRFVEDMMRNEGIHQDWIPDYIERKLYKNILKTVQAHLEHLARSAHVEVAGVRINFVVDSTPS